MTTKSKVANQFKLERVGIIGDLKNIPGPSEIFHVITKETSSSWVLVTDNNY
jgi:hypothetical protein